MWKYCQCQYTEHIHHAKFQFETPDRGFCTSLACRRFHGVDGDAFFFEKYVSYLEHKRSAAR